MWFFKIIVNIKTTLPTYNQELKHLVKTLNSSQAAKCLSIYNIGTKDRLKLHCSINVTQEKKSHTLRLFIASQANLWIYLDFNCHFSKTFSSVYIFRKLLPGKFTKYFSGIISTVILRLFWLVLYVEGALMCVPSFSPMHRS